jgi:hypothetical protein
MIHVRISIMFHVEVHEEIFLTAKKMPFGTCARENPLIILAYITMLHEQIRK